MKVRALLISIVSFVFLHSCAGYQTMKLSAVPSAEQQVGYRETITSQKKHFVSLAPYKEQNLPYSKTSFILFVKNCGKDPVNIGIDNVSVTFEGNTKGRASQKITVLSLDDLMNELMRMYNEAEMDAFLSAQNGKYAVGQVFNANRVEEIQSILQIIETLIMKPRTLLPGESDGGLVVFDTNSMNSNIKGNFQVVVAVDDEEHEFTFNRGLYK